MGSAPPAGTPVAPGATVTLQVSTGDGSSQEMPDVTGEKTRDAQRKLAEAGITDISAQGRAVTDRDDDGRVLSQSPAKGTRLNPGDSVSLVIGQYGGSTGSPDTGTTPSN